MKGLCITTFLTSEKFRNKILTYTEHLGKVVHTLFGRHSSFIWHGLQWIGNEEFFQVLPFQMPERSRHTAIWRDMQTLVHLYLCCLLVYC